MSSPFLPITTPGRAVWIVTRAVLAGRSIWIFEMPACASFFLQELAHLEVGSEILGVLALVGEPLRVPVLGDAEADTGGMNFMTHRVVLVISSPTTTVMWLVRLRMREPRPLARACMRFMAGPSSTMMRRDFQLVDVGAEVVLGVGDRRQQHLLDQVRRLLVAELQQVRRLADAAGRGPGQRPVAPSAPRCARRGEWLWLPSSLTLPSSLRRPSCRRRGP